MAYLPDAHPLAAHAAVDALAELAARYVTERVPRTTSYRDAVAIAVAHAFADLVADPERARDLRAAVNSALDSA